MRIAEFIEAFNDSADNYRNDRPMERLANDLMDAEIEVIARYKRHNGETILVQLDDGKVQLDGHFSVAGSTKGRVYSNCSVTITHAGC